MVTTRAQREPKTALSPFCHESATKCASLGHRLRPVVRRANPYGRSVTVRSKDTTVVDNGRIDRRRGLTGAELFAAFVTGEIFTYQQPVISLGDGTVVQ